MKILVKPAQEGTDLVLESGRVVAAANIGAGVAVELTTFVRRRIAAGEQLNVTPAGGVPEVDTPPTADEALAGAAASREAAQQAAAQATAPAAAAKPAVSAASPPVSSSSGATVSASATISGGGTAS